MADAAPVSARRAVLRFFLSTVLGLGFFAVPVPWGGRWTVLFDVVVKALTRAAPMAVELYCLVLIVLGAVLTHVALFGRERDGLPGWVRVFDASPGFAVLRLCGVPLALMLVLHIGPEAVLAPAVGGLLWGTLVVAVGVIVPVGAVALNLLAGYGALEFVGRLMRPVMRPVYRLPGLAALDNLTSWLGSYSVGLYLTRRLYDQGRYTRREAFIIATGFSTVSMGFVAVVAGTLGLLPVFPLIFAAYFLCIYLVAAIQVRLWPTTRIPDTYRVETPDPEPAAAEPGDPDLGLWREAWHLARARAVAAPPAHRLAFTGFLDGLRLAATILGTILAVGTVALLLATHTPLFHVLGRPLEPVLSVLGLPDAARLAPATLAGIAEMYLPALLVKGAAVEARFFIAVLSVSQLIFFSSVAPMMMDLLRDVPIRARHLIFLFFVRTAILIPLLAGLTAALSALGVFEGL